MCFIYSPGGGHSTRIFTLVCFRERWYIIYGILRTFYLTLPQSLNKFRGKQLHQRDEWSNGRLALWLYSKFTKRWLKAIVSSEADTPRSYYVKGLEGPLPHKKSTREKFTIKKEKNWKFCKKSVDGGNNEKITMNATKDQKILQEPTGCPVQPTKLNFTELEWI